jgi:hypothetical protein
MHVEAGFAAAPSIGNGGKSAYGNGHDSLIFSSDIRHKVVSISFGHAEIAQDDINFVDLEESDAAGHGSDRENIVTPGSQEAGEGSARVIVVFNE